MREFPIFNSGLEMTGQQKGPSPIHPLGLLAPIIEVSLSLSFDIITHVWNYHTECYYHADADWLTQKFWNEYWLRVKEKKKDKDLVDILFCSVLKSHY